MRNRTAVLPALLLLCSLSSLAAPIWSLTLNNNDLSGTPGSRLTFSGTIMNMSTDDLLLDTLGLNFNPPTGPSSYTADYADEFLATLGIIPAGGYSGPLFFVQWSPSVPVGTVGNGVFDIGVVPPGDPQDIRVTFTARVEDGGTVVVPEPGAVTLVAFGLLVLTLLRTRSSHAR